MAEETKIDDVTPEAGVMDVVKSISDNQRADAIDKLQDLLYARSSDAIGKYKALIAEINFEHLDGPIKRVGAADAHVPYNWHLEEKVLVQNSDIQNALIELLEY